MEETRTVEKQQLVFNMLTGEYDYKSPVVSPRDSGKVQRSKSNQLSPRETRDKKDKKDKKESSVSPRDKKDKKESSVSPRDKKDKKEKKEGKDSLSVSPRDSRKKELDRSKSSKESSLSPRGDKKDRPTSPRGELKSSRRKKKSGSTKSKEVKVPEQEPEPIVIKTPTPVIEDNEISFDKKNGNEVKINSEWKGKSAGGCMDDLTWRNNPQIFFSVSETGVVDFRLQSNEKTSAGIGFYIFECPQEKPRRIMFNQLLVGKSKFVAGVNHVDASFTIKKSTNLYVIVPTTYTPKVDLRFKVFLKCQDPSNQISAQLISEIHEWPQPIITGEWKGQTAGGCGNENSVVNNPQYSLKIARETHVSLLLLQPIEDFDSIGLYLIKIESEPTSKLINPTIFQDDDKLTVNPEFGDPNEVSIDVKLQPGNYVIVPSTFDPNQESTFQLMVMSDDILPVICL